MKNTPDRFTQEAHGKVHEYGSQAAQKIRDAGEYVKQRSSELGEQIQYGAGWTRDWFNDTLDDYPLAIGAAFFTLGLIGGLAVPSTKPENRLMGPTRDRLMNQAQTVGSQLLDKGEEIAERAVESVKGAVAGRSDQGVASSARSESSGGSGGSGKTSQRSQH